MIETLIALIISMNLQFANINDSSPKTTDNMGGIVITDDDDPKDIVITPDVDPVD